MSNYHRLLIWKKAPFLRLLIPVIAGILFQYFITFSLSCILISLGLSGALFIVFSFLPVAIKFKFNTIRGCVITGFLIFFGSFLTWQKEIKNHSDWYGNYLNSGDYLIATIKEPPQGKEKTYKAVGNAEVIIQNGKAKKTTGNFLIYFQKDSSSQKLKYGDQIIVNKVLSPIHNLGNPASFDYKQYCAFHQLFHQAYLQENDWRLLSSKNKNPWMSFIFSARKKIVSVMEEYLGKNDESAIAEALLIGYKVDLDKDLVQAYSNAGVVHIIAISGLHIGIIYAILVWLFSVFLFFKKSKVLRLFFIVCSLWVFTFLTGAAPSVVRATIMFSFIIIGSGFDKKSSIYNSLAASAFFILCFNPFALWDVGFQLSYLAVLGIVIAYKPISNWFNFKNIFFQKLWQLAAVSISAQLFTFPLCLFYFHQFPLLFLFTNLIAVPLSTVILCGCLFLIFISPVSLLAAYFAKSLFVLIWLLNHSILFFDTIPFSLWQGIQLSLNQLIVLYASVLFFLYSILKKDKTIFKWAIVFTLVFAILKTTAKWHLFHQRKIIVYNIQKHKAIEFINNGHYIFSGDSDVLKDKSLFNYNLKPSHIAFGIAQNVSTRALFRKGRYFQFYHSKIAMIDTAINYIPHAEKVNLDYIIISKNPDLRISDLIKNYSCKNYIFDASNTAWKIEQWKKECEELHLHSYSVPEKGAFTINL